MWFGILFGAGLWPLDAAATTLPSGGGSYSDWVREALEVGGPRLPFRALSAAAFGVSLWRGREQERQVRELRAAHASLRHRVGQAVLLIGGHARMIAVREGWPASREAVESLDQIRLHARRAGEALGLSPGAARPEVGGGRKRVGKAA